MKGILFNLVEDVVSNAYSPAAWDDAIEAAGVSGAYTALGDYPDAELTAIVGALESATGIPATDLLVLVGREAFAGLVDRQPQLVEGVGELDGLLHRLDDVIHPEVLKLYPDARPPSFEVVDTDDGWLLGYRSDRGLCRLAEGLLDGAARHYATPVTVEHETCVHRGDDDCRMRLARVVPEG